MTVPHGILGDCGTCGSATPQIWCEYLLQSKQWPGIAPYKLTEKEAFHSTKGDWRSMNETAQRLQRIRFATKHTYYDGFVLSGGEIYPVAWEIEDWLTGDGHTPKTNPGSPASFDPYGQPSSYTQDYNHGWVHPYGPTTLDLTSRKWAFDGQTLDEYLSDPVLFPPLLQKTVQRLNERSWDEIPDPFFIYMGEGFDEPDPAFWVNVPADVTYSGDPSGDHVEISPWSGSGGTGFTRIRSAGMDDTTGFGTREGAVFSDWFWREPELPPTYTYPPLASQQWQPIFNARRTRWRCSNQSVGYFIAKTLLYYEWRWVEPEGGGGLTLQRDLVVHDVAKLVAEGSAAQNEYVEISCPYGGNDNWTDFVMVNGMLSVGAVSFAIIGESKEAWKERTGMKLVGAADDLITTADDDVTVDD